MKHVYSSVDIGTDTIKIVVCELYKNRLNLLAASSVKSNGIKKGLITDVDEATISLKQAFNEVEQMLGIRIKKVIASVPSYFADFSIAKGQMKINNEDNIITGEDIMSVLEESIKDKKTPDKEIVSIIPIDFSLDDKEAVTEPRGMVASELKSRSILVKTPKKNIYSVIGLLESIGVEVVDISLNSIGDIYALKSKENHDKVGAIINVGADTTTVSLYNKDVIVKSSIITMGGRNIDSDISYMYKVDLTTAVRIKEKFALAHKQYASVNDFYEITTENDEKLKINQFEVSEIVMSRIEEILTLAKKEINLLTNREIQYIIVTGGTSNMAHFEYVAQDVLGKDVAIGNVKMMGIRNNKFSSVVGNIVYFINKLKLRGNNYSMINNEESLALESTKKGLIDISKESMLGKVFGYFFGE